MNDATRKQIAWERALRDYHFIIDRLTLDDLGSGKAIRAFRDLERKFPDASERLEREYNEEQDARQGDF